MRSEARKIDSEKGGLLSQLKALRQYETQYRRGAVNAVFLYLGFFQSDYNRRVKTSDEQVMQRRRTFLSTVQSDESISRESPMDRGTRT